MAVVEQIRPEDNVLGTIDETSARFLRDAISEHYPSLETTFNHSDVKALWKALGEYIERIKELPAARRPELGFIADTDTEIALSAITMVSEASRNQGWYRRYQAWVNGDHLLVQKIRDAFTASDGAEDPQKYTDPEHARFL